MNKKGFTLLELLVIITIIGLLATFAVVALDKARAKARDAVRFANAQQLVAAIELYNHTIGKYPTPMSTQGAVIQRYQAFSFDINRWSTNCGVNAGQSFGCIMSAFITPPRDPSNTNFFQYRYQATTSGSSYDLYVTMEEEYSDINCENIGATWTWGITAAVPRGVCYPTLAPPPNNLFLDYAIRFTNSN